jgi:hypothetical protein
MRCDVVVVASTMTANGGVYTWGKRDDGRLGYDTDADQVGPRLVDAMRGLRIQQVGVCASALYSM